MQNVLLEGIIFNLKKDRSNHQYFIPQGMGQSSCVSYFSHYKILVGEELGCGGRGGGGGVG